MIPARGMETYMNTNKIQRTHTERNIANRYFLLLMIMLWGIQFLPYDMLQGLFDNYIFSSVLSELIIVIPAIIMIGIWYITQVYRESRIDGYVAPRISDRLMYRSVKPSTIFMTFLYTLAILPVVTLCNMITMLFVDNTVLEYSSEILGMSLPVAIFGIAVLPPVCEELAFRGIVYGGYRRDCRPVGAVIMSALLFGLMHGNINQFAYAFIIGIAMALLAEATGSIFPTMLMHFLINIRSVAAMFALDSLYEGIFEQYLEGGLDDTGSSTISILIYAVLSVITLLIAGAIINWISQNEGRDNPLKILLENKKFKSIRATVWSVSLIIGIIAAVAMMVIAEAL